MKTPKIDLKELKEFKKKNLKERLKFIDMYSEWVKKHDKNWSKQQKDLIDSQI